MLTYEQAVEFAATESGEAKYHSLMGGAMMATGMSLELTARLIAVQYNKELETVSNDMWKAETVVYNKMRTTEYAANQERMNKRNQS